MAAQGLDLPVDVGQPALEHRSGVAARLVEEPVDRREAEPHLAVAPDRLHPLQVDLPVGAAVARGARRTAQEPDRLVVKQGAARQPSAAIATATST